MKRIKVIKEYIVLAAITILSVILNFVNLAIEGYSNQYYAAGVKSMTTSLKNFLFVALDSAGFVSIDKPPLGFWMQAISAKIFGFSGWSILIPQALAGVISVVLIYFIVKRSFGSAAGLISALCLAVTPVFVAVSRNNTVDNQVVLVLLLACWALSIAAQKGKFKYLALSMVFVGLGFNIKMLQAYMILPGIYVMYLFSNAVSIKKRITHLIGGTVILLAVSVSWALVVDSISAEKRPYVGSSNNNTVMGLITGHNGTERLGLSSIFGNRGGAGQGGAPDGGTPGGTRPGAPGQPNNNDNIPEATQNSVAGSYGYALKNAENQTNNQMPGNPWGNNGESRQNSETGRNNMQPPMNNNDAAMKNQTGQTMQGNPPSGNGGGPGMTGGNNMQPPSGEGGPGGGSDGLTGTFGNQTPAGITRLFSKNVLSDQIVWFIPLAVLGFLAAAIREKLRICLDNKRKQALILWFMWFLPEFIYFSYNTGLFHSYYLTMLAPPIAALTGIGITSMWEMYKEGGWKSWFLPAALLANGAVQLLMLTYFYSMSNIIKILMGLLITLCFGATLALMVVNLLPKGKTVLEQEMENIRKNKMLKIKEILVGLVAIGLLAAPLVGSSATMFYAVNSSFPGAGLELLPTQQTESPRQDNFKDINRNDGRGNIVQDDNTSDLITFLNNNKVNGKSQIVVSSANTAERLILNSDVYVGSLSGFMGNETVMSLDQFKQRVKSGELRYVLASGNDGNDGRGGSNSEIMEWVKQNGQLVSYAQKSTTEDSNNQSSQQVYDLIGYIESSSSK